MPTLYVENVPEELYQALRERSRANRRSISAEVLTLLEENVPTARELERRRELIARLCRLHAQQPLAPGPFPAAEQMVREDRER